MKAEFWLKLSKAELNHIETLIKRNEDDGVYYSPCNQYWNRSNRIKNKIKSVQS